MVTEVRPVHPENAELPILVTELGIVVNIHPTSRVLLSVSIRALQLSRESYLVFPLSTQIEVSHNENILNLDNQ